MDWSELDKWCDELEQQLAKKEETNQADQENHTYGLCPGCKVIAEEAFDYDLQGNELFRCEACGIIFSDDGTAQFVVDNGGF